MPPRKEQEPPILLDPNPPPPDGSEIALAIIARQPWKRARATRYGKPQTPHEYWLRNSYLVETKGAEPDEAAEADFIALFDFIQEHGRPEKFGRSTRLYLYPGDDRKYWAMLPTLEGNGLINRMQIVDDLDRLRKTGQIE
jgi:hypothetical protein